MGFLKRLIKEHVPSSLSLGTMPKKQPYFSLSFFSATFSASQMEPLMLLIFGLREYPKRIAQYIG